MKIVIHKYEICTELSSKVETVYIFVVFAVTSTSVVLCFTGFGLIINSISTGFAIGLFSTKKFLYDIIMINYTYYKFYETAQQTVDSFDKLYTKG